MTYRSCTSGTRESIIISWKQTMYVLSRNTDHKHCILHEHFSIWLHVWWLFVTDARWSLEFGGSVVFMYIWASDTSNADTNIRSDRGTDKWWRLNEDQNGFYFSCVCLWVQYFWMDPYMNSCYRSWFSGFWQLPVDLFGIARWLVLISGSKSELALFT